MNLWRRLWANWLVKLSQNNLLAMEPFLAGVNCEREALLDMGLDIASMCWINFLPLHFSNILSIEILSPLDNHFSSFAVEILSFVSCSRCKMQNACPWTDVSVCFVLKFLMLHLVLMSTGSFVLLFNLFFNFSHMSHFIFFIIWMILGTCFFLLKKNKEQPVNLVNSFSTRNINQLIWLSVCSQDVKNIVQRMTQCFFSSSNFSWQMLSIRCFIEKGRRFKIGLQNLQPSNPACKSDIIFGFATSKLLVTNCVLI